jgi:hypothetical protein
MEFNRNHYMAIGLILVLLGLQFRYVESLRLTPQTTKFLAEKLRKEQPPSNPLMSILPKSTPAVAPQKTIRPPKWLGYSLISIGAVLIVQSLGMRKPE